MRASTIHVVAWSALWLSGCGREASTSREPEPAPPGQHASSAAHAPAASPAAGRAKAVLSGTAPGSPISGTVTFVEAAGNLQVTARITNAPPGPHGFHIHEHGNCGGSGAAAGGHFNPEGMAHGYLPRDGAAVAHAGDMGNLEVGADGTGTLRLVMPDLSLMQPPHGVIGRAVILHELVDDFGQPTGNAGGRIACGVIEPRD